MWTLSFKFTYDAGEVMVMTQILRLHGALRWVTHCLCIMEAPKLMYLDTGHWTVSCVLLTRSDIKATHIVAPPQTLQTVARVTRQLHTHLHNASDINQVHRRRCSLKTSTKEKSWIYTAPKGNILVAIDCLEMAKHVIQHWVYLDERWWKWIYGLRLVGIEDGGKWSTSTLSLAVYSQVLPRFFSVKL